MTNLDVIVDKVAEINDGLSDLQEAYKLKAKELFTQASGVIFENFSEVKCLSWQQYTPYFNDGDECVFRQGEVCAWSYYPGTIAHEFNQVTFEELEDSEKKYRDEGNIDYSPGSWNYTTHKYEKSELTPLQAALSKFNEIQQNLDEDTMKVLFGNHVEVFLTKDKVIIEEYDHE